MLFRLSLLMLLISNSCLISEASPPEKSPEYTSDQKLIIASFQLDVARVKALLEAGANPDARLGFYDGELFLDRWSLGYSPYGSNKWTPLQAVAHSHREPQPEKITENTLEARNQAEEKRKQIDPKLIQERDQRRVKIAKLLIDRKAKLDLDDGYGATALDASIYNSHDSLSLTLIEAGANPNTQTGVYLDGTGDIAPIHRATKSPTVLKALMNHGARVNVQDDNGNTPLHWAVYEPNAESVKLLIAGGADVNAINKEGFTAMPAIKSADRWFFLEESDKKDEVEKKKIAQLLIAAGAKKLSDQNEDHSKEDDSQLSEVDQLRLKFLKAKPGWKKGTAALTLFQKCTVEDINNLCYDEDDSIALCAAWQRLEKQMDARLLGSDRGANVIPVPHKFTREFLGFVEGRLKVPVPYAWSRNLLRARYDVEAKTLLDVKHLPFSDYQHAGLNTFPSVILDPIGKCLGYSGTARFSEDAKAYQGVDTVAEFPPQLKDRIEKVLKEEDPVWVTGIAGQGRAVYLLHQDGPVQPVLTCIATKDNPDQPHLYWRTNLDSCWLSGFKGARWFTEFHLKNNRLYLFHCNDNSIGIESISLKDGSRVFSFNSSLPEI